MSEFKYVGKRLPRYDGMQHATASTRFVGDIKLPGMLYVKSWRSPVPSARIRNIDISKAQRVAGVAAVITHKDVPNNLVGDFPVLADHEVRFIGQDVVAVAAVDEDTAIEAIEQVQVDLEERESVLDPFKAMEPDSPQVRPEGNFLIIGNKNHQPVRKGDVEAGFAQADHIIESYFRTAAHEHAPIETQVGIAQTDAMGRTHIWTVSQAVFFNQGDIAGVLGVPQSKVHMIGGVVGGGFGGKNNLHVDHINAVLSLYTNGHPVKWVWTREEEMIASTHRGVAHFFFKDGVTKDGRIIARKVKNIRDAGAYAQTNAYVIMKQSGAVAGPHPIPNVWIDSYAVFTNKRPVSSMRGFGMYQTSFASEVQIERIAKELGIDSWRIRFINAVHDGDRSATGTELLACSMIETMQLAAERAGVVLDEDLRAMRSSDKREEA